MKKIIKTFLISLITLSIFGCASKKDDPLPPDPPGPVDVPTKVLLDKEDVELKIGETIILHASFDKPILDYTLDVKASKDYAYINVNSDKITLIIKDTALVEDTFTISVSYLDLIPASCTIKILEKDLPPVDPSKPTTISLLKEDGYAYFDLYQGNTCLVIEGTFANVPPTKEQFEIRDDNHTFSCTKIEINRDKFIAYFDIEQLKNNQDVTRKIFIPSLYFDNKTFDGSSSGFIYSSNNDNYYSPSVSYVHHFRIYKNANNYLEISSLIDVNITIDKNDHFAYVEKIDNDYIFVINGTYETLDGVLLNKESLKIIGDGDTGTYYCNDLSLDNNHFTAQFKMNEMFNKTTVIDGREKATFNPHLYVNEERFDNNYGDVASGVALKRSEVLEGTKMFAVYSKYASNMAVIIASKFETIKFRGFIEGKDVYAQYYPISLYKEDNKMVLLISGWFGGVYNDYHVEKECFELFQGDISFTPFKMILEDPGAEYEGGTRFKLYYDVTSLKDEKRNSEGNLDFYCHMRFNGKIFDNENGDVKPGAYDGDPDWTRKEKIVYDDNNVFRSLATFGILLVRVNSTK